jgi:hypothetical protein
MKTLKLALLGVTIATTALVPQEAKAALFDFSYTFSTGQVAGKLDGILQGDGNTVLINSFSNLTFAGSPAPNLPFIESVTNLFIGSGNPPATTLNGIFQDFITCTDIICDDGFALASVNPFGFPAAFSGSSFGQVFEDYEPQNWSLTPVPGTPVPGPLPLLGVAAAFGYGRKLRKRIKASKPEGTSTTAV